MIEEKPFIKDASQNTFDILYQSHGKMKECKLWVGDEIIKIILENSKIQISISDTIGLLRKAGSQGYDKFILNSFVKRKKLFHSERRYLESVVFYAKDNESTREMEEVVIEAITNRKYGEPLKLLIYFCPVSGSNAKKHLNNILTFIQHTNLEPEVFVTERRNHCTEHAKTINPKDYCGVAIVAGDGLVSQFLNACVDLPITHVPGGSGNAFAKTQTLRAGENCHDEEVIYLAIKNRIGEFNIMKYELEKEQMPIYSFASLEWAFLADIDMNSEFLRCLGGYRFDIYSVYRILNWKRYQGRITYSTTENTIPPFDVDLKENPKYQTIEDQFSYATFSLLPYLSQRHYMFPLIEFGQRSIDLQYVSTQAGKFQLTKFLLKLESGTHCDQVMKRPADGMQFSNLKMKSFRLEPLNPNEMGIFGIDGQRFESQKIQGSLIDRTLKAFI